MKDDQIQNRWAIHNFDGYDPYPEAESAQITSFVDFGAGDGLLRFSLGCGLFATNFSISENSELSLPSGANIIKPNLNALECDPELLQLSMQLSEFIQDSPLISMNENFNIILKTKYKRLELASVEFVLTN